MTENERWNEVCKPKLEAIDANVKKLVEFVITGNGKPALASRVDALERANDGGGVRRKTVKIGPLELNGYAMSDVVKAGVLVVLLACAWLLIVDRKERQETIAKARAIVEQARR